MTPPAVLPGLTCRLAGATEEDSGPNPINHNVGDKLDGLCVCYVNAVVGAAISVASFGGRQRDSRKYRAG